METKNPELSTEAAIYAEGTPYSGKYLAGCYEDYVADRRDGEKEPDDFQRWIADAFPSCCKARGE